MTSTALEFDLPPDHLLRQIIDAIAAHPEVREPLLRVLLTEDFLALPAQMKQVQGQLGELQISFEDLREETREGFRNVQEQFRTVNERLDDNTRAIRSLEGSVGQLRGDSNKRLDDNARAIQSLEGSVGQLRGNANERLDDNTRAIRSLEGSVGQLRGDSYENLCAKEVGVILDGWLDGPVLADREWINALLLNARRNDQISRSEYLDGLRPDIIAHGMAANGKPDRYAVIEASITFNRDDLETAVRRARIIGRVTDTRTDAFIATSNDWPEEINEVARQLEVTIIQHQAP